MTAVGELITMIVVSTPPAAAHVYYSLHYATYNRLCVPDGHRVRSTTIWSLNILRADMKDNVRATCYIILCAIIMNRKLMRTGAMKSDKDAISSERMSSRRRPVHNIIVHAQRASPNKIKCSKKKKKNTTARRLEKIINDRR